MPLSEMRKSALTSRASSMLIVKRYTNQHVGFRTGKIASPSFLPPFPLTPPLSSPQALVTLSNFGLTQVLTDVVGNSATIILTSTSAVR